jgi:hypothetical protein
MGRSIGKTLRSTRSVTCTPARRARFSRRRVGWSTMGRHCFISRACSTVVAACSGCDAVQRCLLVGSRAASTRRLATCGAARLGSHAGNAINGKRLSGYVDAFVGYQEQRRIGDLPAWPSGRREQTDPLEPPGRRCGCWPMSPTSPIFFSNSGSGRTMERSAAMVRSAAPDSEVRGRLRLHRARQTTAR